MDDHPDLRGATIAVSGIRDLAPASAHVVELAVCELIAAGVQRFVFGGARGTDTVALAVAAAVASDLERLVIVPGLLREQPAETRSVTRHCATEVCEMGLSLRDPYSYQRRNLAMLDEANVLVAFSAGSHGGTANTIRAARHRGIPIIEVAVERGRPNPAPASRKFPFVLRSPDVPVGTLVLAEYVSATRGLRDDVSSMIRALKAGADPSAWQDELDTTARAIVPYLRRDRPILLVPMPRSMPQRSYDLAPLVAAVTKLAPDVEDGTGALIRAVSPTGGFKYLRRQRHTAEEHAASMHFDPTRLHERQAVVLLDNVLTTGGTLAGAVEVVRRAVPMVDVGAIVLTLASSYF